MDENKIKMHIQARRIGAMEIMCLLNSKPIIKLSSRVEFLTNAPPELRTLTIRRVHEIERNPDDPYYPSTVEKYFNRPDAALFDTLTYAQYFQQYSVESRRRKRTSDNGNRQIREE